MEYKLIAIDMDGTLLNSKNEISNRTKETLLKAIDEGKYVVLSTGRILRSALFFGQAIELNNPIIACNGALISSGDEKDIIYEKPMNLSIAKKVVKSAQEYDIYYHFYDINTFYSREAIINGLEYYESYGENLKEQQINVELFKNPMEVLEEKKPVIYKFVFIENDIDILLEFRKKLSQIEGINISSSWDNNIEVMNEGVSKGQGLKYLIEKLNIDKSEVVAIGDNENDISMFEVAGLAIGMKNGDESIKDYVHTITDTNDEDGVAKAIEKHVLKK